MWTFAASINLSGIDVSTGTAQVIAAIALIVVALGAFVEALRTRRQAVRPVLALDLVTVGGLYVEVGIANIGQGAALDVDVDLAFVREDGDAVRNRWTWPLVRSGERFLFAPPDVGKQQRPNLEMWAPVYPRVTLTGTVRDQLRRERKVKLEMGDLQGLRSRAMAVRLAGLRETPEQRHSKTLAKSAEAISSTLERVADALEGRQ